MSRGPGLALYQRLIASPARMAWSLVGFTFLTRLPLLTYPKACDDEQVYVVVAIEMLRGGRPYSTASSASRPRCSISTS